MEKGRLNEYNTYLEYLEKQKEKTTNPQKREKWLGEEWGLKLNGFKKVFSSHSNILKDVKNALALGARTGQEVVALRDMGIDAIGLDLVAHEPLVIEGDFHNIPFPDNHFDLVFTNCFDHSLYPEKMIKEIERVLKPGGYALMHFHLGHDIDEYSETEVFDVLELIYMFGNSRVVLSQPIKKNFASMNYEVLFKKNQELEKKNEDLLLSIVITTFNRSSVLNNLLKDLVNQSDKNFEVIVAVDGSTDDTEKMLDELKDQLPYKLGWVNTGLSSTYGLAKARNIGIKEASGEAVVILDDDSFPVSSFVAEHKRTVTEKTLTGGARISTDPNDNLADKMQAYLETYGDSTPNKFRPVRTYKYVVENNTCMYKKDWLESGLFDESITEYGAIGQKFNQQLIKLGYRYQFNPRAAIKHHTEFRQNQKYQRLDKEKVDKILLGNKLAKIRNLLKKYLPPLYHLAKKIKNWWEYR